LSNGNTRQGNKAEKEKQKRLPSRRRRDRGKDSVVKYNKQRYEDRKRNMKTKVGSRVMKDVSENREAEKDF
jgi:hypothetical protein